MLSDVLISFFHLLATVVWIGGMIFINTIYMPSQAVIEPAPRGKLFGVLAKRFTLVVWLCVAILVLTGLLRTSWESLFDFTTTYETFLTIKVLLVIAMILLGIVISAFAAPRVRALMPKPGEAPSPAFSQAQKTIKALSVTNMLLGVGVLLCLVLMRTL